MAKARAICICKKCGNEFEKTTIKYNRKQADSWEEWAQTYYDECEECYRIRKEEDRKDENEKSAEFSKESGLAQIKGSEKQIAWANTIRAKFVRSVDELREDTIKRIEVARESGKSKSVEIGEKNVEIMDTILAYLTEHFDDARFWIDNRNDAEAHINASKIAREIYKSAVDDAEFNARMSESEKKEEEHEVDIILRSHNASESGVVTIEIEESVVKARYIKSDSFRAIVKSIGFSWDGECWKRNCFGDPVDAASELANKLLNNGFSVRAGDETVREKAVSGDFVPEGVRWIIYGTTSGKLILRFPKDDKLNNAAKRLNGARWSSANNGYIVSPDEYREVVDFAEVYGFRMSKGAEKVISDEMSKEVIVAPAEEKKEQERDVLSDILKSGTSVIDDLRDE